MTITIVGEHNPFDPQGERPNYALYPYPPASTGGRLMHALGEDETTFMRHRRVNLLPRLVARAGKPHYWAVPEARLAARSVVDASTPETGLVLLGARVATAFGCDYRTQLEGSADTDGVWFGRFRGSGILWCWRWALVLPHPSGLSRDWPGAYGARRARAAFGILAAMLDRENGRRYENE